MKTHEIDKPAIWNIEVSIGLNWFPSVRDDFRHMWE